MINFSQEQIFLFFLVIGVIIGIIFDFFRMLRKSFKTTDTVTFVEDIIFVIISGFLIILGIQKLNSGIVRMYLFIGFLQVF